MRFLITAGPTREAIDPVRYIGNRSSGKMGAALAQAALKVGHQTTVILGPVSVTFAKAARIVDVDTAAEMLDAVLREFPRHDVLVMAAAVADYRPVAASARNCRARGRGCWNWNRPRNVVAAAGAIKRAAQRTVGFSLESSPDMDRVRGKMRQKNLDLMVYNPLATIASDSIQPSLLYADGRVVAIPYGSKADFADMLIQRAVELFP